MLSQLKVKSEFRHNVLTLMTGTTIAQSIPIAISPILTRIYTPDDFGIFALYTSIVAVVSIIATGKYELAIMLPKKDDDAVNVLFLSVAIGFVVSLFVLLVVTVCNTQIATILGNPKIGNWLYFTPVSIFMTSIYQSLSYWSNRKKKYRRLATSRIIQSGTTSITNLGMGYGGLTSNGLITGLVIGQCVSTSVMGKQILSEDSGLYKSINKLKILAVGRKYKHFPKETIVSSLFNSLYNNGKFIIFSFFMLPSTIGQLYLTFRVLVIPVSIISTSIADVLFEKTAYWRNNALTKLEVYNKLRYVLLVLMAISIIPSILLGFYGQEIICFLFDEKWQQAGKFASILALSLFFQFSISPFCRVFYVYRLNRLYLFWEISRFFIVYTPVVILGMFGYSGESIVFIMTFTISLSYIILLIILRRNLISSTNSVFP